MRLFHGKEYVRIALANAYGLGREPWEKRLQWVGDNWCSLASLALAAKDPMAYTKAWMALQQSERGEPTGFIMGLDGTASGIQQMACVTGCEVTGAAVNLVDTGDRQDIYQSVATKMGVSVDLIKPPLMTHYYGSVANPRNALGSKLPSFYEALAGLLPGAEDCMEFLQSLWNPTKSEYVWVMPDKHTVRFKVFEMEDKKIEIDELDHATFTYRTQVNKPKREGLAMAANAIHSIDSWVCREMVRRCKFPMLPIHDAFYAHPNDMNHVRRIYTEVLSDVCQSNVLEDITRQIVGTRIAVPKKASNLNKLVLQSEYALS